MLVGAMQTTQSRWKGVRRGCLTAQSEALVTDEREALLVSAAVLS